MRRTRLRSSTRDALKCSIPSRDEQARRPSAIGYAPPAYFVFSPSFTNAFGAKSEPLTHFMGLSQRPARDYAPVANYGDLTLLRRTSGAPAARRGD